MKTFLLAPPVAFIIIFLTVWALARLSSRLAFRPTKHSKGEGKSYACGEDTYNNAAQPDYSTFFPFAFFFTLAHVAALMMATVPAEAIGTYIMAFIYVVGAVLGLYILFRE